MERHCPYCGEEVPEGTVGRFCSNEHKWLHNRRLNEQQQEESQDQLAFNFGPRKNGIYHGRSPQRR